LSDIFNEVDEDLRRDRALKLWNKYGNYVVVLAVVIVAATAGYTFWRDYDRKQAEASGNQYMAALSQAASDPAAGQLALDSLARDGRAGYSILARFNDAALKLRANDAAGAVAVYNSIAADSRADTALRDAARLLAMLNGSDVVPPGEFERQVSALSHPTNPWRHFAWEVAATAALKAGKVEEARKEYARIADDPQAPAGLRTRAAEMLAVLAAG
jgi:hypothetical protein